MQFDEGPIWASKGLIQWSSRVEGGMRRFRALDEKRSRIAQQLIDTDPSLTLDEVRSTIEAVLA